MSKWTAEQDATLARMAADYRSITEIAAATGKTRKAVRYHMELLGIERRGCATEGRRRRARMVAEGVGA